MKKNSISILLIYIFQKYTTKSLKKNITYFELHESFDTVKKKYFTSVPILTYFMDETQKKILN